MFRPSILGPTGLTTDSSRKLRRELGQRFVPLAKPSDQELRTAAMMALGKELRLATQQCCGGKGWAFWRGLGYIDVYIYMIIYVYILEIPNLVRWLSTKMDLSLDIQKKNRSSKVSQLLRTAPEV